MRAALITCCVIIILFVTYLYRRRSHESFIPELFPEDPSLFTTSNELTEPGPPIGWAVGADGNIVAPGAPAKYRAEPTTVLGSQIYGWFGSVASPISGGADMRGDVSGGNINKEKNKPNDKSRDSPSSDRGGKLFSDRLFDTTSGMYTDISKFDFKGAMARASKAFASESDNPREPTQQNNQMPPLLKRVRGSANNAGGVATSSNATGPPALAPIVDQGPPALAQPSAQLQQPVVSQPSAPLQMVNFVQPGQTSTQSTTQSTTLSTTTSAPAAPTSALSLQPAGTERPDARCGPNYGGAKCGAGRCCSIYGLCGGAGDVACQAATNDPAYNGPNAVVSGGAVTPCALNCNDPAVIDSAEYYYATAGEWKNTYVMNGLRGASSGANTCDILYEFRPKSNPTQLYASGTDRRRFTYTNPGSCNWQAINMGGYMSGTMIR